MERLEVRFNSGDGSCAGWWYPARAVEGKRPVVVMAHGFSLTRHDGLAPYAEAFAQAGAHVLAFDYRHFGDSPGEPRQLFRIAKQQEDYRAAFTFARTQDNVDPARIVLWGFSFAGGHVTTLLADGLDACAGIVLCPFADGLKRVASTPPALSAWIMPRAAADVAGRHNTIPVTAMPGGRAALTKPGEAAGFSAVIPPGSPWRNEVTPGVFATVGLFRPVAKARRVIEPLWVGRCADDVTTASSAVGKLADRAPLAELYDFPGDHFWPFHGNGPDQVIDSQVAFLRRTALQEAPVGAA